jgi:cytidylate kinase
MTSKIDSLVNRAIETPSLAELKRTETIESEPLEQFSQPFITISREPGSGGMPIAKTVAKWLDFDLIDRQIIQEIAKNTKKRVNLVESIAKSNRSLINDLINQIINPEYVSNEQYMKQLSSVIISFALKGSVVIIGQGSNFITPFSQGLHVRISAPYQVRLERAIKYENLNKSQAIDVIRTIDHQRKEFIYNNFRKNISNANYYDLVINTANMSIQDAAEHIILSLKNKFPEYAKKRKRLFSKLLLNF